MSEAQTAARALFDGLVGGTLQSLKAAAPKLADVRGDGADLQAKIAAALPADTSPVVKRFLAGLASAGALGDLPVVIREFERFAQAGGAAQLTGEITSAEPLTDAQRERIVADLRSRYGEGLVLSYKVDTSLIGGLIIRVGDQVLDNSLRTRLSLIQRNMTGG